MDVSGSISEEDKEMARMNNYLLSTWIKYQYGLKVAKMQGKKYNNKDFFGKSVAERHVIFTDDAKEVTQEEFYTTQQSGGTSISSGLAKAKEIIDKDYDPNKWNVYLVVYSDGDSYSDNSKSVQLIKDMITSGVNMVAYGHLGNASAVSGGGYGYGGGNFGNVVQKEFAQEQRVRLAILDKPEMKTYKKAIQTMLAKEKGVVA
jgi:uncharacterized sporulation protein YeaH/YhbH (DUF444 family)